jgi:hypothetical protein
MISDGDFLAVSFWLFEIGFFVSLCVSIKHGSKKKVKTDASA